MSIQARWRMLAICSALALALAACGKDSNGKTNADEDNSTADGTGQDGTQDGTGGDGTDPGKRDGGARITIPDAGGSAQGGPLGSGVAGKECKTDTDCGAGGSCRDPLRGGVYGRNLLGTGGATGGYCTADCQADADCGEGGVCFGDPGFGGECRRSCKSNADCKRDDYECAKLNAPIMDQSGASIDVPQTCQPLRPLVKLTDQVGQACSDDAACNGGTCRTGGRFPDGYCSGACEKDADCGAEGVCVMRPYGSGGSCYETCTVDTDCKRDAMSYGCVHVNDTITVCAGKMDPLPDGIVGNACTDDMMCGNGQCAMKVGPEQVDTPDGYCSALGCEDDAQCGAGGSCVTSPNGSRCYKGCSDDTECRTGYACTLRGDNMKNVCFPGPSAPMGDAGA